MTNKELMKKTFDAVHLSETAKQKLLNMEKNTNHQKKRKPMHRLLPLIAALALIFGLSCAVYGVVNMYNTHWGVGSAENESFEELTKPFATESSSSPYPSSEDSDIGTADDTAESGNSDSSSSYTAGNSSEISSGRSDIIKDYSRLHIEGSTEVEVTDGNIPSTWFSPSYMIILTGPDGSGWELETGETLSFDFSLLNDFMTMELGYVCDGVYYDMQYGTMYNDRDHTYMQGNRICYTIAAERAGTYYFCITNCTSGNAVIAEGGRVFRGAPSDLLVTSNIVDYPSYSSNANESDMIKIACDAETQDGIFTRVHAVHNQIIIFTKPEKEGWELKKGDTLHLEAVLENSLAGEVQVGYILDNACYPLSDKTDGAGLSGTFTAPEDGTYYFYMINRSGEEMIISEGKIY